MIFCLTESSMSSFEMNYYSLRSLVTIFIPLCVAKGKLRKLFFEIGIVNNKKIIKKIFESPFTHL